MKSNVEGMKSFGVQSPHAPVGEETHPKHGTVKRIGMRFELTAKIHRPAKIFHRCIEGLDVRIVDDLEFVVINEWLSDGWKVQEDRPQQEYKVWNEAAASLHGRYYVKVRRASLRSDPSHRNQSRYHRVFKCCEIVPQFQFWMA